ncbi:hypothetical protein [Dyella tabacisoli]|uniref:Uncharacterized protein n=1 Tax=Dyella tabacisoli TaxID=2282381 RepID=A0A369UR39_9GAMM|nr:hypothetical protein [Dyella tabacisoli]RDD83232.1 hypothetical protein DVJ77_01100 [Dyella tabacisoli]
MKPLSTRSSLAVLAVVIACAMGAYLYFDRPSNNAVGLKAAETMQHRLDTTAPINQLHMIVGRVYVTHAKGNKYQGVAFVNLNGDIHQVPVDITLDGEQLLLQVQPGSLMFATQELLKINPGVPLADDPVNAGKP